MNDALLHVNETATRTRLLSNASRTDEISWELEETRAIYRDVQLIPGPAQSGVPITQISSPTRLKQDAVNSTQDATCLQRARRRLYIPKQLKPIKTAAAGNWPANSKTECDASQETFSPCCPAKIGTSLAVSPRLSRQVKVPAISNATPVTRSNARPPIVDHLSFPIHDLLRPLTCDLSFRVYCPRNAKDQSHKNHRSRAISFFAVGHHLPYKHDSDNRK